MTTNETTKAREGRDLWLYYVKINGYSFRPNDEGLKKISRLLDLDASYIKHRINLYLEA
ncbi:MAG: hypothetical protein ABIA77_02000 [Candidatus Omnitrophota bacterium]